MYFQNNNLNYLKTDSSFKYCKFVFVAGKQTCEICYRIFWFFVLQMKELDLRGLSDYPQGYTVYEKERET